VDHNAVSTSYNADSNPLSQTDALGHTTSFGYDSTNENLLYSQTPLEGTGNRTSFAYANANHPFYPTSYSDPQGHSWSYGYDENTGNLDGNLTSMAAAGQQPVVFKYNANGSVATATDQNGNVTTYGYDAKGNLTSITPPSPLGPVSITYDSLSRIQTITDGKGQTRTYTYNPLDRVTQIAYSNGPTITSTYDADGNLTSETDATGSYSYSYDALNRLSQETTPQGTVSYGYDNASNLTGLTDPSGTTTYAYDPDNLLSSIREPAAANPITFQYDANGNRTEIDYPNGISEYLSYDNSQRLTSIIAKKPASGTVVASFSYSYTNGSGADTNLRQSLTYQYPGDSGNTTISYGYDSLERLTSATGSGHSYSYAYGPNGNMTSKTVDGTTSTYNYNGANQVVATGYSYDVNGSQTSMPGETFSYNPADQTTQIVAGSTTVNQSYNGLGQASRVSSGSTTFLNDQLGINRTSSTASTTYYTRDTGGTVLGERNPGGGSGNYYFLFDGLGSTVAVTDNAGNIADTYHYDPYGNITSSTGTVVDPFRFAGGYYGSTIKLYKFGERYYDPNLGRWTQQDPVNNPLDLQGWNQYKYAGDNPINNIDPSGMCWTGLCWVSHAAHAVGHFVSKHKQAISCGLVAGATIVAMLDPAITAVEIAEIAAARAEAGAADAATAAAGRVALRKALTRAGAAGVAAGGGYIGGFSLGSGCLNYIGG